MNLKSSEKYAPAAFEDLVFPSPTVERTIRDYKDGHTTENLLLYGPPGTGKSTIARLIPALVEPNYCPGDVTVYHCSIFRKVEELQNKIGKQIPLFANGDRRYVILEEVDNLNVHAMQMLKSIMDIGQKVDALFVLTTNEVDNVSKPVIDRCEKVYVGLTSPEHWLSRARSIIQQETGNLLSDDQLLQIISTAKGSGRQAVKAIQKYLARRARHQVAQLASAYASQKEGVV